MRTFMFFAVGGILGFVAGGGAMLIAFPFLFPPPPVNESVGVDSVAAVIAETRFREGTAGQDGAHWGRGGVKIYRTHDGKVALELQDDFEVGAGPNFWIYLNGAADINDENDFNADETRLKIAKLKSFSGSQVYKIDAAQYGRARAVTIWCETFGQYIASANVPRESE